MVQPSSSVKAQEVQTESIDCVKSFEHLAKAVQGVARLAAQQISTQSDLSALVKVSKAMRSVFRTVLKEWSQENSCQKRLLTVYLRARADLSEAYGAALKNIEKL